MRDPGDWAHWGNNALNGFAPAIDPTWLSAARTIATTLIDLVTDSGLLAAATAEFRERTGGGIGGEKWVAPLLPARLHSPGRPALAGVRGNAARPGVAPPHAGHLGRRTLTSGHGRPGRLLRSSRRQVRFLVLLA